MGPWLPLARFQLRRTWRSWIGISLLVALAGGLTLGAAAGATRTWSAVDRMQQATEAWDVFINPDAGMFSTLDVEDIRALPMVADVSRAAGTVVMPAGQEFTDLAQLDEQPVLFVSDGGAMMRFARPVLAQGRFPAVDAPDEVFVDQHFADDEGLAVGDVFDWQVPSTDEMLELFSQTEVEAVLARVNDPGFGTPMQVRVVGIGTTIDGVVVDQGFEPIPLWVGPAFAPDAQGNAGFWGAAVRLQDGVDISAFREAVDALVPEELIVYQTREATEVKVERATAPGGTALAVFAGVTALLGLLVVGQAMSRRLALEAADNGTLATLGTTRRERFSAAAARVATAAVLGSVGALGLAWLLSWLTPVGPARRAEPTPGLDFDAGVLLTGAGGAAVAVALVGLVPAWRSARRVAAVSTHRGSRLASTLGAAGAPVSTTVGVRFGLEPGRGASAVPTRATILGAATGVAVAVATVVFAASLDRVVDDPYFYGSNFDAQVQYSGQSFLGDDVVADVLEVLAADVEVTAAGEVRIGEVVVDGREVPALSFDGPDPQVAPTIAEGRAPVGPDEIALGGTTMRQLDVGVGDRVTLADAGDASERAVEVVGRAVLPGVGRYQASDKTALGEGAIVSSEIHGPRDARTKAFFVVDLDPDADPAAFAARAEEALVGMGNEDTAFFVESAPPRPADIEGIRALRALPLWLAGLLVALVGAAVVHALVVAVRRRRRDLAVLQVLGSTRRSVRAVGMWQGLTTAGAALLVGVPTGVAVGRWAWTVLMESFGTVAEPVVRPLTLLAMVAAVLVLTAVVGVVPALVGLRRPPATVLRAE